MIREPPAGFDACRSDGLAFVAALRETFPQGALVLGGFSQGAMTATDLALSLQKDAPLAGILHISGAPLVVEKWARDLAERRHHILISHGEADPTLPFVVSTWTRELFAGGGAAVEYHKHPGGHGVGDEATLRAIGAWLKRAAARA